MIYLNNKLINVTIFPDKTSQVWKIDMENMDGYNDTIRWEFDNEGEFMHLVQLVTLIRAYTFNNTELVLQLPYLPYGRQDKSVSNDQTFALRSFMRQLSHLNFSSIEVLDPHSNVVESCMPNVVSKFPAKEIYMALGSCRPDLIVYPDLGALDRYSKQIDYPSISASKSRNQQTGYIENIKVNGDVKGKSILLVDDICDFGNTFILLTKKLLSKGAKEVNLYVTHGIFSGGLEVLRDSGIVNIYTKDGKINDTV